MNEIKIKAAFRQVQEDCKKRNERCEIKSKPLCKHFELCNSMVDAINNRPISPKDWNIK